MADLSDVDMSNIQPAQDFAVLPDGEYVMFMTKSEKKANSKGTGHYLALEFGVIGGTHDGAKIFHNLNLWNPNDIAVNIAKSEWLVLCQAIKGVPAVKDSSDLHDKRFVGTLAIEERKDKEGNSHDPKKYGNKLVCKEGKVRSATGSGPAMKAHVPQSVKPAASVQPAASVAPAAENVQPAKVAVAGTKKAPWD